MTGLISVLGPWYLVGLALLASSFILGLARSDQPGWLAPLQTVLVIVAVGGLGSLVESAPRNSVTYIHLGFAQYITAHGAIPPPFDARVAWPGMFAALASVESMMGHGTAFAIGRWAPLVFDLLWLPGLLLIAHAVLGDRRARWLAVWIFFVANWTEQSYLSPQALNMFMYLTVIGVTLAAFGGIRAGRWRRFPRWASADGDCTPPTPWSDGMTTSQKLTLLVLIMVLGGAMSISHQLTPFLAVLVLGGLVAVGRIRVAELPWIMGVLTVGWLSFEASSFWSGHLSLLFGGVGNVTGNVASTVTGRIQGDTGHVVVLLCRIGMSMAVVLIAAMGYFRLWLAGRAQRWVPVAAALPALTLAVQNYGGEGSIRVYLFALPFLAPLAAAAVGPGRTRLPASVPGISGGQVVRSQRGLSRIREPLSTWGVPRRWRKTALALSCILAISGTIAGVVATYGGDSYEQVSQSELAAVKWFYNHVPTGAVVFTSCVNLPWRYQDIAAYQYKSLSDANVGRMSADIDPLIATSPVVYLILTRNQEVCGEQYQGLPPGWLGVLERNLVNSNHATPIYSKAGAVVFRVTRSRIGTRGQATSPSSSTIPAGVIGGRPNQFMNVNERLHRGPKS